MSENTAVATQSDNTDLATVVETSSTGVQFFSSVPAQSFAEKIAVVGLMDNTEAVESILNKPFGLAHFITQPAVFTDKETGEVTETVRITLVDSKGKSFHCSSMPVYRTLLNLRSIMGHPATWPEALPVTITREGKAPRAYFALKVTPAEVK